MGWGKPKQERLWRAALPAGTSFGCRVRSPIQAHAEIDRSGRTDPHKPMNFRHGYHAGNFADVLKHLALCELLRLLTAKDKKLFVLDTHAGAGSYDLAANLASRTREAETGIVRLMAMARKAK